MRVPPGRAVLFALCCLSTTAISAEAAAGATVSAPVEAVVRTAASTERSITFELALPQAAASRPGGRFLELAGLERTPNAGEPDLPTKVVLIGVPQSGRVRLSVQTGVTEELSGITVNPAHSFNERDRETSPVFSQDRFWPEAAAVLEGIEVLRGVRVARVRLNPVQYNPVQDRALVHRRLAVTLSFDRPAQANPRPDPLDGQLRQLLLNGSEAVGWKLEMPQETLNFFDRSTDWCRIETETTGIYRVTPAELQAAGFDPAGIAPAGLKLYALGPHAPNGPYPDTMIEVPLYVSGGDDGKFDGSDFAAFFAEAPSHWDDTLGTWQQNLFTNRACFWLTWGPEPGLRMATVSGAGATNPLPTGLNRVRLETDSLCPARSGLLWFWDNYFKIAAPFTDTFQRVLGLARRDTILALRGRMFGRAPANINPPHYKVAIKLNGYLLDTLDVTGVAQGYAPADFASANLPAWAAARGSGPDTISFELLTEQQTDVFLDYLEVDYRQKLELSAAAPFIEFHTREAGAAEYAIAGAAGDVLLLEVTDPWRPKRIADTEVAGSERRFRSEAGGFARFACGLAGRLHAPVAVARRLPGRLRSPAEDADYYVVAPDEFYEAAKLYARYREGNVPGIAGARARAVRLAEVCDDYAFGWVEPGAIKRMFGAKQPAYGLLAGDATYDYRNCLNLTDLGPGVPAYEQGLDIDPEVYSANARGLDAWYADWEGSGISPDMILGRITCRSPVELRMVLDKVRHYETQPLGLWARRFLLLGDDEYLGDPDDPRKRESFIHIQSGCEPIAGMVESAMDVAKVYLTEYPYAGVNDKPGARAELKRQLDAGALLWFYFGHGAGFRLAHEQALNVEAIPAVHNGGRTPFAFYGSCGVGRFEDTRYQAIAEELVRKEDGCIATVGATKATTSNSNEAFAQRMLSYLLAGPDSTMGSAFYQSWALVNNLHHFFGDPAAVLRMPRTGFAPDVQPDTFYPGGRNLAIDSVPVPAGEYDIQARDVRLERYYESNIGHVSYLLQGSELFRGGGRFDSGMVRTSFVVPSVPYPETLIVANGYYARVPASGAVGVVAWDGEHGYTGANHHIPVRGDTAVQGGDIDPPEAGLYADGLWLRPGETTAVPKRFTLRGELSDESGILLTQHAGYRLSYYVNDATQDSALASYFEYDNNSSTRGRFSKAVELEEAEDSIVVTVADNYLNRAQVVRHVRTDPGEELRIDSALVYPNPTAGAAYFTFELTRPAQVSVKIFTISGRLVRYVEPRPCAFGYNQLDWDGLDNEARPLANGIYLYKLDARASATDLASIRDRLLVHR